MAELTLFEKIAAREIPADIVFEDSHALCFRDVSPQAPVHLLLVPKKVIPRLQEQTDSDRELLGHLMSLIPQIAEQEGFAREGYRVVINNGEHGGETVPHLHIHILAGRPLEWPPG